MFKYYITGIKKSMDFDGRARRREFWVFALMHAVISSAILVAFISIVPTIPYGGTELIVLTWYFLTAIPLLAAVCRRLHDTGKSGWWIFIQFVPLVGPIWHLINLLSDSEPGGNQYGPNPKQRSVST